MALLSRKLNLSYCVTLLKTPYWCRTLASFIQLQNNNKFNCGVFELHFLHFYQNVVKKLFLIVLSGSNTQYLHEKKVTYPSLISQWMGASSLWKIQQFCITTRNDWSIRKNQHFMNVLIICTCSLLYNNIYVLWTSKMNFFKFYSQHI